MDEQLAQGLKNFDAVWHRVKAARSAQAAAEARNMKLMPRGKPCPGRAGCQRQPKRPGRR